MKFRNNRRRLTLSLVFLTLAAAGGLVLLRGIPHSVTAIHPERGMAVEAVYATGTVEPENWARIGSVTSGRIAEILVSEGETVRQGQALARLDDREARARVAELEARAAYWREEVSRSRSLAERGIRPKESEQKAQSEYNQVIAAINAARQRRADLIVTSPMDGVVLRRDGEPGEVANMEDTLFWVGEPRPLRITADVDEEDIARVRPGQRVLIKADAFSDRVLDGTIDRITPKGDPINKTFRVRVRLPDDTPLLIGMTTEINIVTAQKTDALLLPAAAVTDGSVLVVENGVLNRRKVATGIKGRNRVEILDGVTSGDNVIATPSAALKPGDRVKAE